MDCEVIYEELAAFVAGDLDPQREAQVRRHVGACAACGRRASALAKADATLAALRPARPSARAILDVRRALAEVVGPGRAPEVLTLDEVAQFLRIGAETLDEIAEELPAFELGGQIRVRREKLMEWIRQREQDYARGAAASWAAQFS